MKHMETLQYICLATSQSKLHEKTSTRNTPQILFYTIIKCDMKHSTRRENAVRPHSVLDGYQTITKPHTK